MINRLREKKFGFQTKTEVTHQLSEENKRITGTLQCKNSKQQNSFTQIHSI